MLGPRGAEIAVGDGEWANAAAGSDLSAELRSPGFLAAEYGMTCCPTESPREQYLKVRRPGRGVALDRGKRGQVWDIIEAYRSTAAANGATDWDECRHRRDLPGHDGPGGSLTTSWSTRGAGPQPDLARTCPGLVAPGPNDLSWQKICINGSYGNQVALKRPGINIVGWSKRLTLNYRTTDQNLRYALGILSGEQFVDLNEEAVSSDGYRSARSGPKPFVVQCESPQRTLKSGQRPL